jgi:hypothetical protein
VLAAATTDHPVQANVLLDHLRTTAANQQSLAANDTLLKTQTQICLCCQHEHKQRSMAVAAAQQHGLMCFDSESL